MRSLSQTFWLEMIKLLYITLQTALGSFISVARQQLSELATTAIGQLTGSPRAQFTICALSGVLPTHSLIHSFEHF